MRSLKKLAAVLMTVAMTISTSIFAFGSQEITFHFENAKGWDTVAAHVYEGVGFTTNVSPIDKCLVVSKNDDGTPKPVWPGAKMEHEFGNWYKITVTFEDVATNGLAVIFNNGVGDVEPNDVGFNETDAQAVKDSGIPNVTNATKDQTGNVTVGKKALAKLSDLSNIYVTYDGKATGTPTDIAPDSYKAAQAAAQTPADNNNTSTDNNNGAAANNNTTTNTGSATNTGSTTTAPKTGDTVALTVVMCGLLATVAFVASKKRVND